MVFTTRHIIFVASIVFTAWGLYGCSSGDDMPPSRKADSEENESSRDARWVSIVANCQRIDVGMSQKEVCQILGQPDQSHPLFEPKKHNPRQIGASWFYMKEPKPNSERGESEIVVRFNMTGAVTGVDSWGLGP